MVQFQLLFLKDDFCIEAVSFMGKDGYGLKLGKVWPLMICLQISSKYLLRLVSPD